MSTTGYYPTLLIASNATDYDNDVMTFLQASLSVRLRDDQNADEDLVEAEAPGASGSLSAKTSSLFLGGAPATGSLGHDQYYEDAFVGCVHRVEVRKASYGQVIDFAGGDSMVRNVVGVDCREQCTV